jgi:ATP-dependent DNA ligase
MIKLAKEFLNRLAGCEVNKDDVREEDGIYYAKYDGIRVQRCKSEVFVTLTRRGEPVMKFDPVVVFDGDTALITGILGDHSFGISPS